jgi:hypothetical protein
MRSRGGKGSAKAFKALPDGSEKLCASCDLTFMYG